MYVFVLIGGMLSIAVTAEIRLATFRLITGTGNSATIVDKSRQAASILDCVRICWTEYSNCFSVTYNTNTGACTPRSWLTKDLSNPIQTGEELFYYTDICDATMGFEVYAYGSAVQCFYISTETTNFTSAKATCEAKGSRMFMIKSSDKLEILRHMVADVTGSSTWVGLTDQVTEGEFVWADNEPAENVSFPIPWDDTQPDDAQGGEDCVEMGKSSTFYINDFQCILTAKFICEKDILPH